MLSRLARTLALLLLAWQAVLSQAHTHAPGQPAARAAAVSAQLGVRPAPAPHRPDGPLDCPVCREIAHNGAYVSPGPIAYSPPAPPALWLPVASLHTQFHGQRSHAWRSRAPPSPLLS